MCMKYVASSHIRISIDLVLVSVGAFLTVLYNWYLLRQNKVCDLLHITTVDFCAPNNEV
jgi:hypothetical protein